MSLFNSIYILRDVCVWDLLQYEDTIFHPQCDLATLITEHLNLLSAGNLASVYYEQGNMEMAIFHYRRAITCDTEFLEAYNNLVGTFFHLVVHKSPS